MTGKIKILHIITSLELGGAELMLFHLLENLDKDIFENHVICLVTPGRVAEKIEELGIEVETLGLNSGVVSVSSLVRLYNLTRKFNPAIIHTWLYHADLLGGVIASILRKPVIWAIHNTSLDPNYVKRRTILIARINAVLSKVIPRKIIIVSETSRSAHIQLGYDAEKFISIPNGVDTSVFFPDPMSGEKIRNEIGIATDAILIGLIARFDPLKDHQTFILAAGRLLKQLPDVHFLLCGKGITKENPDLLSLISDTGFNSNFHLLGERNDIPFIMNALDINTLSSIGEAFPNVIGEAMACGKPTVATDVGDIAYLVGDTGLVVPPKDPSALVKGWLTMINLETSERREIGNRAHLRMVNHFSIANIADQYQNLYKSIVKPFPNQ